ncbi:hypothetical protein A9G13_03460 [Gilliamella sp. wkB178]|uniref:hypothetical protein n=1 Tax=Gilliamella sp. wkB178 TaxID=3120259 RepID=UPI00080EAC8D|nr:hypothetical protein [Gilliamella apicola]OCG09122.1 hypothetical protein A9G13_03460 [Gilliamella apicola]
MSITWIRWYGFLQPLVKNFINHAKILGIVLIFILIPSSDSFAQIKAYRNMTDHKLFNPEIDDIYLLNLANLAENDSYDFDNSLYEIYLEKLNKIDDTDITKLNIQKIKKYKNLYVGMKLVKYESSNWTFHVLVSNMAFTSLEQAKLYLSSPLVYSKQDDFWLDDMEVEYFRENRIITNVIRKSQSKPIPNPYKYAFIPKINDVYIIDLVKYEADNREYSWEYSKDNIYQKLWSVDNIYPPEFYEKAENKNKKVYVGMKLTSYSVKYDSYGFAVTTTGFSSLNEAKIKLPLFDFNRSSLSIAGSGIRRMMNEGIIVDKVRESEYHVANVDKIDEVDN